MLMNCKTSKSNGDAHPELPRLADWPERLDQFIQDSQSRPFEWGSFDCFQICAKAEMAIKGQSTWPDVVTDKALTIRQTYKLLRKFGVTTLWQGVDLRMNRWDAPRQARRGDWVGHYVDDEESLGVSVGDKIACIGFNGLSFKSMSEAITAWRV